MYLEVEAGENAPVSVNTVYADLSPAREAYCVLYSPDGEDPRPMQVVGWDNETQSPCPAYARHIEESGDGVALLVYGGTGGIRLKDQEDETEWSLQANNQWGESHLVYLKDSFIVYRDEC